MGYQEMYKQKLVTAEEAVKVVKSGQWVDYEEEKRHDQKHDRLR